MAGKDKNGRKGRLEAALQENLRRRKAQAKAKAQEAACPGKPVEAGLENKPYARQKTAPKAR